MLGDFHFLWECLKVIMEIYWGKASQHGSLCNLKEVINRKQVEKKAKNFCTCVEFILHVFKSHMIAAICDIMKLEGPNSNIPTSANLAVARGYGEIYCAVNNNAQVITRQALRLSSVILAHCISIYRSEKCYPL